jgi:hypothetical protein
MKYYKIERVYSFCHVSIDCNLIAPDTRLHTQYIFSQGDRLELNSDIFPMEHNLTISKRYNIEVKRRASTTYRV